MKFTMLLIGATLLAAAAFDKAPDAKVRRNAPHKKWTELVVRGKDAEFCRRIAARFTDSPTQEIKVYDQGQVWPEDPSAAAFVLPWWNTNALCQIETSPRGLSPIGHLDLLSLAPEDRCDDARANFIFHSQYEPTHFEHWPELRACAAWSDP